MSKNKKTEVPGADTAQQAGPGAGSVSNPVAAPAGKPDSPLWLLVAPIVSYVLFAAHLLFHGWGVWVAVAALVPLAFIGFKNRIASILHTVLLWLIGLEWVRTTGELVKMRIAEGMEWERAAAILAACACLAFAGSWIMYKRAAAKPAGADGAAGPTVRG